MVKKLFLLITLCGMSIFNAFAQKSIDFSKAVRVDTATQKIIFERQIMSVEFNQYATNQTVMLQRYLKIGEVLYFIGEFKYDKKDEVIIAYEGVNYLIFLEGCGKLMTINVEASAKNVGSSTSLQNLDCN
jgi:hypothetical protein